MGNVIFSFGFALVSEVRHMYRNAGEGKYMGYCEAVTATSFHEIFCSLECFTSHSVEH